MTYKSVATFFALAVGGIGLFQCIVRYAFYIAGSSITEPALLAVSSVWFGFSAAMMIMTYPSTGRT